MERGGGGGGAEGGFGGWRVHEGGGGEGGSSWLSDHNVSRTVGHSQTTAAQRDKDRDTPHWTRPTPLSCFSVARATSNTALVLLSRSRYVQHRSRASQSLALRPTPLSCFSVARATSNTALVLLSRSRYVQHRSRASQSLALRPTPLSCFSVARALSMILYTAFATLSFHYLLHILLCDT